MLSQHWTLSIAPDVYLQFNSDGSITYYSPSSTPFLFTPNGSGGFTDPPGLNATLTKQSSDGAYHLDFHKNQETYEFDSSGRFIDDEDKNNKQITYNYTNGQMTSITDTQSRTTTFTYNSQGQLTTITDPSGRKVLYTYDASGNLATSTDALGQTTTYAYETGSDDLTQLTDPAGHIFKFAYNDTVYADQVASLTEATGAVTSFSYDANSDGSQTTVVTDARGNQTTYDADASMRVTKVTDALGHTQSKTYTPSSDVATITDSLSSTTQFIPIRFLRDHSKMREGGERTQTLRVVFKLIESFTHVVNHVLKGGKGQIRELFFAQFFPHMFHGTLALDCRQAEG